MKKLVYVLHAIKVGGVEVALLSAIPELNRHFNLSIIVLGDIDESLVANFSEEERRIFKIFNYKITLFPFLVPYIVYSILAMKPDIIVSSLWRGSIIGTLVKNLKPSVKFFSFIHSTYFAHGFDEFFSKMAISKADIVLSDSQSSYNFVKGLNANASVEIVSFLTNETPSLFKTRFNNFDDEIRFMILGRLNTVKNIPLAVEVISYLRGQGIKITLDIYGRDDGAEENIIECINREKMQPFITLKGEISPYDRFDLFNNYNGLIQLSSFEGMAMSVVEAMQYGLLCVVTPVGEIPNYSKDLFSAVFMLIENQGDKQKSLEKLKDVLSKKDVCNDLARNAQNTFRNNQIYTDSLIKQLSL